VRAGTRPADGEADEDGRHDDDAHQGPPAVRETRQQRRRLLQDPQILARDLGAELVVRALARLDGPLKELLRVDGASETEPADPELVERPALRLGVTQFVRACESDRER